jgi:nucleotidyltransferase substrate binding protein (TIGR01987 family)
MKANFIIEDFSKALEQFSLALKEPATTDLIRAGCIQYFEFCFELAWKAIKIIANEQGLMECTSPKSCVKLAFKQHWIDDEQVWLDMLMARNLMSHTYHAEKALKIYHSLTQYEKELHKLLICLENQS